MREDLQKKVDRAVKLIWAAGKVAKPMVNPRTGFISNNKATAGNFKGYGRNLEGDSRMGRFIYGK